MSEQLTAAFAALILVLSIPPFFHKLKLLDEYQKSNLLILLAISLSVFSLTASFYAVSKGF